MLDRIKNCKILVVGLARSGRAAIKLLANKGAREIVANDKKELEEEELKLLHKTGTNIELVTGSNSPDLVTRDLSMIVKSPGVPPDLDIFKKAYSMGIPVIPEIELAYYFIKSPIIGITGTNGKTTTTMLTATLFQEGGWNRSIAAGNIGLPLCEIAEEVTAGDIVLAELSSFQLEHLEKFRPWVAVILNLTEDHLDYHGTMDNYLLAKSKILENQSFSDMVVLNYDDTRVKTLKNKACGRVLFFSKEKMVPGFCVSGETVGLYWNKQFIEVCPLEELSLKGEHNLENVLAASASAWAGGVDLESISKVLRSFPGVEHRMEKVREIDGVIFINDSKGTNPQAAIKAMQAFPQKKVLIAGGKEKGGDFKEFASQIKKEVKYLILLGETAPRIAEAVKKIGYSSFAQVTSIEEAVRLAWSKADSKEIVLLSPACASWDMFNDFEERGWLFKKIVMTLKENG